jgi:hypothetical protein
MTEDIRELREKVLAMSGVVESGIVKYRLREIEERLSELMRLTIERNRPAESPS